MNTENETMEVMDDAMARQIQADREFYETEMAKEGTVKDVQDLISDLEEIKNGEDYQEASDELKMEFHKMFEMMIESKLDTLCVGQLRNLQDYSNES